MSQIVKVLGREILDSRGVPAVEVEVALESGFTGRAGRSSSATATSHATSAAASPRR